MGRISDDPLSDMLAQYSGRSCPTTKLDLMTRYSYSRSDLRYLTQSELEKLQGAIHAGFIDPPQRPAN